MLVFEAEEDAFRFLRQMKNVPDDAGVGLGTIDIAREFAGEHGGLVELVAAGDDEPSVIIRP